MALTAYAAKILLVFSNNFRMKFLILDHFFLRLGWTLALSMAKFHHKLLLKWTPGEKNFLKAKKCHFLLVASVQWYILVTPISPPFISIFDILRYVLIDFLSMYVPLRITYYLSWFIAQASAHYQYWYSSCLLWSHNLFWGEEQMIFKSIN